MNKRHKMGKPERAPSAVVFGCGNPLIGDDGFGPAVIEQLLQRRNHLPLGVSVADVGTGVREYLFDYLLSEKERPRHLIIVDAIDREDKKPGEVFEIDPSAVPAKKLHDFSLHQFPTVNMLQELQQYTDMKVTIVVAQVDSLPQEVSLGLSPAMAAAVPKACKKIMDILSTTQSEVTVHDV
ncbi:MAG: hydrogenase maturation protease [Thermodesulfobacteriota bacterium]